MGLSGLFFCVADSCVCVCVCVCCVCVSYLGGGQWSGFLQVEICLLDGSGTYLEARGCGGSQHPGQEVQQIRTTMGRMEDTYGDLLHAHALFHPPGREEGLGMELMIHHGCVRESPEKSPKCRVWRASRL